MQCATFTPGDKSVKINDLDAGKRYTFRIKAVNSAGESEALESRAVTVQKPSNPPVLDAGIVKKLKETQNLKSGKDFRLKVSFPFIYNKTVQRNLFYLHFALRVTF